MRSCVLVVAATLAVSILAGCGPTTLYTVDSTFNEGVSTTEPTRGIGYRLPISELWAEIEVTTVTQSYGDLYCYRGLISGVSIEDLEAAPGCSDPAGDEAWSAEAVVTHRVSGASVGARSVPDERAVYAISPETNRAGRRSELRFAFAESGLLTGASSTLHDNRVEIVVDVVETSLEIAASIAGFASGAGFTGSQSTAGVSCGSLDENATPHARQAFLACKIVERIAVLEVNRAALMDASIAARGAGLEPVDADMYRSILAAIDGELATLRGRFSRRAPRTQTVGYHRPVRWGTTDDQSPRTEWRWCINGDGEPVRCEANEAVTVQIPGAPAEIPSPCRARGEGVVYRLPTTVTATLEVESATSGAGVMSLPLSLAGFGDCFELANEVRGNGVAIELTFSETTGMLTGFGRTEGDTEAVDTSGIADGVGSVLDGLAPLLEDEDEPTQQEEAIASAEQQLVWLELQRQLACYAELGIACPDEVSGSDE